MSLIVVSNRLPFVLKRDPNSNNNNNNNNDPKKFPSGGLDPNNKNNNNSSNNNNDLKTFPSPGGLDPNNSSSNNNSDLKRYPSAGGLVTAVAPVVVEGGGFWVGWTGLTSPVQFIPESSPEDKTPTAGLKSDRVVTVDIDLNEYEMYYNGFCNATLWPLFHSMPDKATFNRATWKAYKEVNAKFAQRTLLALDKVMTQKTPVVLNEGQKKVILDGEGQRILVWIQDYHLLLCAAEIRKSLIESKVNNVILAFFLHIPFPAFDLFRILPWQEEILEGMMAFDLLGFHDEDYCANFLDSCGRGGHHRVDKVNKVIERDDGRSLVILSLNTVI